jgi:hypothetical protein
MDGKKNEERNETEDEREKKKTRATVQSNYFPFDSGM